MTDTALFRAGALIFGLSGAVNLVADLLPGRVWWNLAGVAAGLLGLATVWLWQRRQAGWAGAAGYGLAMLGLTGIAGFLFADAAILPYLAPDVAAALFDGPTGLAIFAAVILYTLGLLVFVGASLAAGVYPRPALALWALGVLPTPFALALPPPVMTGAEIVTSIGILWVCMVLWRLAGRAV